MIEVLLNTGRISLVDYEDAWVLRYMWQELPTADGRVYAQRHRPREEGGGQISMHRDIMKVTSFQEKVDHKDGDGLHNWRSNLRVVTNAQNARNLAGGKRGGKSAFLGVSFYTRTGKWIAYITHPVSKKYTHLGYFDTEEQAHYARLVAELSLVGVEPRRLEAFQKAGLA